MGNVQNTAIGNQILPMESYLVDVPELRYIRSLGATRFMKTAIAEKRDGLVVGKLFVYENQMISTQKYVEVLTHLRRRLKEASNCLPFVKIYKTDRSVILQRPYGRYTLYDRLSTRPFLLEVEKQWIAFQLLKALGQLRISMACHGDLKSQNVLVSSTNWVRLTDFAPFKPAFVPYDNPSTFTFFFDTSRRRNCYLSPERFKKAQDLNYLSESGADCPFISDGLTHEMDIFSMGCVLVELLTDGRHVAFNLSQAIDYTRLDEHVTRDYLQKLLSVCPPEFAPLLEVMLDRDPSKRRSGFEAMSPCTSNLFPPLFESYLFNYLKDLQQIKDPDQAIVKLFVEFPNYNKMLEQDQSGSTVLIISMVTAQIRACRSMSAKMDAVVLLKKLCALTNSAVITDRIIPFFVHMLNDYYPQVRAEVVYLITDVLENLDVVPQDESRLLVDYIFPKLKPLTEDKSDYVKMALASCLGRLATVSLRFYDESVWRLQQEAKLMATEAKSEPSFQETLDSFAQTERAALQEVVSRLFVNLSDSSNAVKECLFASDNLNMLCKFFGTSKDADVLMHMITLLNDKRDWQLRAAFFRSCPTVARHCDAMQNSTLVPFLQQGLQDTQEFVTSQTLTALYHLCNDNKLEKTVIVDIMKETVPFLIHPNKWFRVKVVNLLCVLDSVFSLADMYCKLMPLAKPYLSEPLIRLNDKQVVLNVLVNPIPRNIWDFVVGLENVCGFMKELADRRTLDKLGGGRSSIFSAESDPQSRTMVPIDALIKKLTKLGLNEQVEDQLLAFQANFSKMEQLKKRVFLKGSPGIKPRAFDLENGAHTIARASNNPLDCMASDMIVSDDDLLKTTATEKDGVGSAKVQLMEALQHKRSRYMEQKRVTSDVAARPRDQNDAQAIPSQQGHLLNASTATVTAMANAMASTRAGSPTAIRRPEIRLQAHLHEHSGSVLQLAAHPHREVFASCSADQTVKLWSASQYHMRGVPAVVSIDTLKMAHRVNSLHFMNNTDVLLVMGMANGELSVRDTSNNRLLRSCALDKEDGAITQVYASEHLVFALTHHSQVYCFDIRDKVKLDSLYKCKARNSCGLITGFTVDPNHGHWMMLTASSATTKNMMLWDLRFGGLEVDSWAHPTSQTPFRSWPYLRSAASDSHCQQVFTNSAKDGELSLWDLGTKYRTDILWPSPSPPLQYSTDLVTSAVVSCPQLDGIFTGDSEGSIRYWNLEGHPFRSNYLCGPYRRLVDAWLPSSGKSAPERRPRFEYMAVDLPDSSARVQVESRSAADQSADPDFMNATQVGDAHRDAITDMIAVGPEQLVSAARNGVIKIWKTVV